MACVALSSLIATIELEFLQSIPRVSLHDQAPIKSLYANLSSLQAFLRKESSGGDAAEIKDLEIEIRDFALEAEDNIEILLTNILFAEDRQNQEKAFHELHQTLREAAKNATELLKILAREKDSYSCVSQREMASVVLTILMTTFEYYFLQPIPLVLSFFDDEAPMVSFFESLSSLQALLLHKESSGGYLETKIRDFSLKAECEIGIKLNNFLLAKDTEYQEGASQELRQTIQESAESAAELLKIINKEKEHKREREMICSALTSLKATIDEVEFPQCISMVPLRDKEEIKSFFEKLSSLQAFLLEESSGRGGATPKIVDFALKSEDIQIQLSNFFQAKDAKSHEEASRELHPTLQEATENATKLLKIITEENEYRESGREMASVTLTVFMKSFEYYFLDPIPLVYLDDEEAMISLFEKLSSLKALLQKEYSCGAAINGLETEIRYFLLKAEDDIGTQVNNLLQAKDTEYQEKAFQLNQTLQEAADNAAVLLMINGEKDDEIEMACVALSSLMGTIEDGFLDDEAVLKSFLEKISSLRAFLLKESSGGVAETDLETKIKDFALKAGDNIKIKLNNFLPTKEPEYQEKEVSQELHQTIREAAESATELLELINSRSNEVDEANETQPSDSWLKHASKIANVEFDGSSQCFLKLEERMVGRNHDCRVIKDQLLSSRSQRLISIVGMVGIGKTTLARNVYGDPSVASHFDVRGWVTIPQDYNKSQMLSQLLGSITPAKPNVIKKGSITTANELEMQVRKCLLGRRYLIVLDNILSNQAWIDFRQCVPNDVVGSCILLTTSHFKREYYDSDYIHHMTLLDPKESWDLFCNIFPIKEHMAPNLEKIRDRVVEKCDGLPQLIVEVVKRLSKCNNIQEGWKKIEKELESLGILDRNALTISYNLLPHHLKVCFLYFGVFPKRNKILVKMLIRLWLAEGFVKPLEHKELENQAYEYLQDLIDRSLLLIGNQSFEGKIKTCRMHSAMHSFCVGEAQKEGVLCAVNTRQHSGLSLATFANSCRWLSVCSHSFDYYVLFSTNIPRSIFFFLENPEMLVPMKLLRVLAFDSCIFLQRVPMHFGNLVYLRYLSITQWFEDLDDVVSNNPNLQTLVVSGNGSPTVHLPSSIWKPPHLRHLELGNLYRLDPPSIVKENLQSLSWAVRPIHCRKEVYEKLPNIKKLKIFLKDDIEEPSQSCGSCSNPLILDSLDYLEELEKLTISVSVGCSVTLTERSMFPSQLKKLRLSGTNLSQRDLTVIGMLPQLMVLKLENAFHGTVWKVSSGGFRRLRFLLLEDIKLKQWEWETCDYDHFSMLERLVLRFCYSLEHVPSILADIPTLQLIVLEKCHSSLIRSATQIQTVQRNWGNDMFEIKILGPEYDESQNTDTYVSIEDDLARLTLSD